jgi:hypothetical protein
MIDVDYIKVPDGRKLNIEFLAMLKAVYERERNPYFVWLAYDFSRHIIKRNPNFPLPEWIYEYLDEAAEKLLRIRGKKKMGSKIASALNMIPSGPSIFTKAQDWWLRFIAIQLVLVKKGANPEKNYEDIYVDVAKSLFYMGEHIEHSTIQTWFSDWKKEFT